MSDQETEQLDLLTMEDRVKREVAVIFDRHQMLRDRMNDPSSTPSERMTAARLAEKLERKRAFAN